jgi:hypothetical protein
MMFFLKIVFNHEDDDECHDIELQMKPDGQRIHFYMDMMDKTKGFHQQQQNPPVLTCC